MDPKLSFQKVGQTALGEAIYQDEHGQFYIEKNYERLVKAILQELPPEEENMASHNKSIREEDLLDVVEDLEKRRRKLLVAVTDNFVSWGRLLGKTEELIEEYKRRKWKE